LNANDLIGYHNYIKTAQMLHHDTITSCGQSYTAIASPSSATASPLSLTKPQQKVLLFSMKKNLCHAMFTNAAMPHSKDKHNNIIQDPIKSASDAVLSMHPPSIKLRSWGVNHMWETCSAFHKYAENTVDKYLTYSPGYYIILQAHMYLKCDILDCMENTKV
jgi:hypothetical protein